VYDCVPYMIIQWHIHLVTSGAFADIFTSESHFNYLFA